MGTTGLDGINPENLSYIEALADEAALAEELLAGFSADDVRSHSHIQQHFLDRAKQNFVSQAAATGSSDYEVKQIKVLQLINAYRFNGHLKANLDPLGQDSGEEVPELEPLYHGLTEADLDTEFESGSFRKLEKTSLREIIDALRETYCSEVGVEYMHMLSLEEKRWIQEKTEPVRARHNLAKEEKKWLLQRLAAAETFERFLHTKYVGQKRFSLEGGESLIPLLNVLIEHGGAHDVQRLVLGMAHRGRLNVLINILGKKSEKLFAEFAGDFELDKDQTGDVKYHMGFSADITTEHNKMHLSLAFNPSHLEIVNPVVEGYSRFHQDILSEERSTILPVLIHGDAAFAGQGVIMETLNMSQSRGFHTQGTVHIIVNNQIGFTTSKQEDARSTYYCTDVAKMVSAPIFHVNAENLESVVFVTRLALEYRMRFKKDVVIDLVCYRRHGHNEADEPAVTQPVMYHIIRNMDTTREAYAKALIKEEVVTQEEADLMVEEYRSRLEKGERVAYNVEAQDETKTTEHVWQPYLRKKWQDPYDSALSEKEIKALSAKLLQVPDGFEVHPRVVKLMEGRAKMAAGEIDADWGFAENLAYASLANAGTAVRLSGQDCGRGTFSHRHAVLHNQSHRESYISLQHLHENQGQVQIIDSVLSEEAVLGFEYGYATANPESLVIWEAQFGDFANGAQAIIDQFILSAETKWGRLSGLVLLLPHGLEGQGPEHSSARLERFLQGCARYNVQVCVPSTASQIFHLLRRQIVRKYRKPLIVFTPKSLLRHKLASSPLHKFSESGFKIVIGEQYPNIEPEKVTRVVLCSGKVFYDLLERRQKDQVNHVAILRIEQLYPFSHDTLRAELENFPNATEVVWAQEEPINQGAWYTTRHNFVKTLGGAEKLWVVARGISSAPAEGSMRLHTQNQNTLVEQALGLKDLPVF